MDMTGGTTAAGVKVLIPTSKDYYRLLNINIDNTRSDDLDTVKLTWSTKIRYWLRPTYLLTLRVLNENL